MVRKMNPGHCCTKLTKKAYLGSPPDKQNSGAQPGLQLLKKHLALSKKLNYPNPPFVILAWGKHNVTRTVSSSTAILWISISVWPPGKCSLFEFPNLHLSWAVCQFTLICPVKMVASILPFWAALRLRNIGLICTAALPTSGNLSLLNAESSVWITNSPSHSKPQGLLLDVRYLINWHFGFIPGGKDEEIWRGTYLLLYRHLPRKSHH